MASVKSKSANSAAIDPGQLLALCYHIKETLFKLDKSIRLAQLRLRSLSYARNFVAVGGDDDDQLAALRCSSNLAELEKLSQTLVEQMDELQGKLGDYSDDPISFQIATQQLAYFTSEWHENLAPKLEATLGLANEQLGLERPARAPRGAGGGPRSPNSLSRGEARVREALMRLKQSMEENERLILAISSNLECTKTTIQAIFESLQATKANLATGDENAREAVQTKRRDLSARLVCYAITLIALAFLLLVALRLIGLI